MIELSWKRQVLVQASYNSEFYCAKVTKKARVYIMHYRLNTIVFLEFGHCKSSSCQEQKMVGLMLGLHEALPKWQFDSIIVFFKVAYCSKG